MTAAVEARLTAHRQRLRGTGNVDADHRAALAIALMKASPAAFAGIWLRGGPGAGRDAVLAALGNARRIPISADRGRLLGGLDLSATLTAGAPRYHRGLLDDGDSLFVVSPAERLPVETAGLLACALDGISPDGAPRAGPPLALVAVDEAGPDDATLDARLAERLAFAIDSDALTGETLPDADTVPQDWRSVTLADDAAAALTATALAFGVVSLRASLHTAAAARAIAAIEGRSAVEEADIAVAAALVIAPKATQVPAPPEPAAQEPQEAEGEGEDTAPPPPQDPSSKSDTREEEGELGDDRLVEAVAAALPEQLLAGLASRAPKGGGAGRAGSTTKGVGRRPAGVRAGLPGPNGPLALVETLTAAAPWQRVRQSPSGGISVRQSDLRVRRLKTRAATTIIFCVDASGSQAFARMAEAKGAVERLLAQAYVRRDQVALVAFRKEDAEVLLPPTTSLTRTKRALTALPGGGGTPLAAGIAAGYRLAERALREGREPTLMILSDGRANVTLEGTGGREVATQQATAAARTVAAAGIAAVVVDTGRRPGSAARNLATAMGARYAPLPRNDERALVDLAKGKGA
ncbi:MAG: VWA domain-containing protein [Devosia sp.]